MEPFSPDLIAQIATKLFREGSHSSEAHAPNPMPNSPMPTSSIRERLPTQPGMPALPESTNAFTTQASMPYPSTATPSMATGGVPASMAKFTPVSVEPNDSVTTVSPASTVPRRPPRVAYRRCPPMDYNASCMVFERSLQFVVRMPRRRAESLCIERP